MTIHKTGDQVGRGKTVGRMPPPGVPRLHGGCALALCSLLFALCVPALANQTNVFTGTVNNDGTGDQPFPAFTKINGNFNELYGDVVANTNALDLTNWGNIFQGTFNGNAAGLTNLPNSFSAAATAYIIALINSTTNAALLTNDARVATLTNAGNTFVGTHSGPGAGLTGVTDAGAARLAGNASQNFSGNTITAATGFTGPGGNITGLATNNVTGLDAILASLFPSSGIVTNLAPGNQAAANQVLSFDGTHMLWLANLFANYPAFSNACYQVLLTNSLPTNAVWLSTGSFGTNETAYGNFKHTNGTVTINELDAATTDPLDIIGSTNNYFQSFLQNTSSGASASADFVAANDKATPASTNYFVDLGINSSGNTDNLVGQAYDAYLYASPLVTNLYIVATQTNGHVRIAVGGFPTNYTAIDIVSNLVAILQNISVTGGQTNSGPMSASTYYGTGSTLSGIPQLAASNVWTVAGTNAFNGVILATNQSNQFNASSVTLNGSGAGNIQMFDASSGYAFLQSPSAYLSNYWITLPTALTNSGILFATYTAGASNAALSFANTINASNLTAGGTMPAENGAALTALSPTNLTASGTFPAENGSALTSLSAANITPGGTLPSLTGSSLTNMSFFFNGGMDMAALAANAVIYATLIGPSTNAGTTTELAAEGGIALQAPYYLTNLVWGASLSGNMNSTTNLVIRIFSNAVASAFNPTVTGINATATYITNDATHSLFPGGTSFTNRYSLQISNSGAGTCPAGRVWWAIQGVK